MTCKVKTSCEWQKVFSAVTVINHDGWDRLNFKYSWEEELISEEEYMKRRNISTCVIGLKEK